MKKSIISLIIISLCIGLKAKNFENKQFTLFAYEVKLSHDFEDIIEPLEGYIDQKVSYFSKKNQDKFEGKLYSTSFLLLDDELRNNLSIDLMPVNSLAGVIDYNVYSFPDSRLRKAQKETESNYYYKVEVHLDLLKVEDRFPEIENPDDYICPEITVKINVYENIGILPAAEAKGSAYCQEPRKMNEEYIASLLEYTPNDDKEIQEGSLLFLLNHAVKQAAGLLADQ